MVDFQRPEILDPEFHLRAARPQDELPAAQAQALEDRLRIVCEYGRALWDELAATRRYLRDDVGGSDTVTVYSGARSAMLPDPQRWEEWAAIYERICRTLAGTSGDSGFGRSEAMLIARSHGIDLR